MSLPELSPKPVQTIRVPDALKHGTAAVETLYRLIATVPQASRYVFDMEDVHFIEPCGVIGLVSVARLLAGITGKRVFIKNLGDQVYPYLDRMNLFQAAGEWLRPVELMNEEWSRNANTSNLLELTQISGVENVYLVVERAQSIFAPWLAPDDLDNLIRVISELCQNIYQHSNDPHGCILIQKYHSEAQHKVSICLAVGDSGCGIRSSLMPRFRGLGDEPLDFIRAAMDGNFTSRRSNKGGLGLRTVRNIATSYNGYVTVRSESASITDWGRKGGMQSATDLAHVAGTQVSVKMYADFCS
jgi:anti-sigma regulatory factor (Ser/Thr protein kinase)